MQSQEQAPTQSQLSTQSGTDVVSGAPTCDVDAVGNQARLEDAGLESAPPQDSGLAATLATDAALVLGCLPLSIALPMALPFLALASVRAWVDGLNPADIGRDLGAAANDTLEALWPQGAGFVVDGKLGGELDLGGDYEASMQLIRCGKNSLQGTHEGAVDVGIEGGAAGIASTDAFGQASNGAIAKGGVGITLGVHGDLETSFDLGGLLASGAMVLTDSLSTALLSAGPVGMAVAGLGEQTAAMPWKTGFDASLHAKIEATGSVSLGALDEPTRSSLLEQYPELVDVLSSLQALGHVAGELAVGVSVEGGAYALHASGGLDIAGKLLSAIPALAGVPGLSDLASAAGKFTDSGVVELHLGIHPDGEGGLVPTDEAWIRRTMESTAQSDQTGATATVTDAATLSLPDFLATMSAVDGETLGSLLDGGLAAFSRDIDIPLDPTSLDHEFPNWSSWITDKLGLSPGVQTQAELSIQGHIVASGAAMASLGKAGITPPLGATGLGVIEAIGRSLVALSAGGEVAETWLAPWTDQLRTASSQVTVEQAHAVGTLRAGVGGGGQAAIPGVEADAEARTSAGMAVDHPLTDEETQALSQVARSRRAA